jgi:hydrogenase/urease accessory protein HupE
MTRAVILLLAASSAHAHTFAPSLLELTEVAPDRWQVSWRNQAGSLRVPCDNLSHCCLDEVSIDGLGDRDVLVRIHFVDGRERTSLLYRDAPTLAMKSAPAVSAYVRLGVAHILGGFDHLLFVFALVLLVKRRLLWTLTAFTAAHSLTLALAALGVVRVPQAPVEAAIALSILFVAVELTREQPSPHPFAIAFGFGLLHGLGFAGALGEIGLPAGQIAAALACFNVGVELGQLAFVALLVAAARLLPLARVPRRVPVYVVGTLAAFFCVQRIGAFWS